MMATTATGATQDGVPDTGFRIGRVRGGLLLNPSPW
jgi:hypothetical protein